MSIEDIISAGVVSVLVIIVAVVVILLVSSPKSGDTYYANDGDRAVATEIHELRLDVQKLSTQLAGDKR